MRITTTGALATVAVTALLVTNPLSAQAARLITGAQIKDASITSADVKDRSLLAKDFKSGQLPQGPKGATGATGATGPSGVVGVSGFGSQIDTVAATGNDVLAVVAPVFTGMPTTVSLAEDSTLVVSGIQVLSTSGEPGSVAYALCATSSEGPLTGQNVVGPYLVATASSVKTPFATTGTRALPAGDYLVGTCADPGTVTLDANDYSSGAVQVLAGGVVDGSTTKAPATRSR